jgi:hypothetical protein
LVGKTNGVGGAFVGSGVPEGPELSGGGMSVVVDVAVGVRVSVGVGVKVGA